MWRTHRHWLGLLTFDHQMLTSMYYAETSFNQTFTVLALELVSINTKMQSHDLLLSIPSHVCPTFYFPRLAARGLLVFWYSSLKYSYVQLSVQPKLQKTA